jgi:TonB family protein
MRVIFLLTIMLIGSSVAAQKFGPPSAGVITGPELSRVFMSPRPPEYPYEARRNGWSGRGVYRAFVTPEGKVSRVLILHSMGHSGMDEMVVRAAMQWRAKPGRPKEVDFPIIFVAPPRSTPGGL